VNFSCAGCYSFAARDAATTLSMSGAPVKRAGGRLRCHVT
jgi:hypothetical protein